MTTVKNDSNDGHGSCLRRAPERQAPAPARRIQAQAQVWLPLSQVLGHPWAALRGPPWGLHGLTSDSPPGVSFNHYLTASRAAPRGMGRGRTCSSRRGSALRTKALDLKPGRGRQGRSRRECPSLGPPGAGGSRSWDIHAIKEVPGQWALQGPDAREREGAGSLHCSVLGKGTARSMNTYGAGNPSQAPLSARGGRPSCSPDSHTEAPV